MAERPFVSSKQHWPEYWVKTFRITQELDTALKELAEELNVGLMDLVCYLLEVAVDQVKTGKLHIPIVEKPSLQRVDHSRFWEQEK